MPLSSLSFYLIIQNIAEWMHQVLSFRWKLRLDQLQDSLGSCMISMWEA